MRTPIVSLVVTALVLTGCGKDSSGPRMTPEANQAIQRFTHLADSANAAGDADAGQIFTGAADAIRMAGDISSVGMSVDGSSSTYNALSLSLGLPAVSDCDEFGCYETPAMDENVLLAWREGTSSSVLVIASDGAGTRSLTIDTTSAEYSETLAPMPSAVALFANTEGASWFATGGTSTNSAVSTGGACAQPKTETPGVSFTCAHATYRWSANFTASEIGTDALGMAHQIVVANAAVSGVRIILNDMGSNLAARIGRAPVRTRLEHRRELARGLR